MLPLSDLFFFAVAALGLVISPGPNMIYLISRSIVQGKRAGLISLAGVICGFLFHIILVSFGLTTLLFAVPFAYAALTAPCDWFFGKWRERWSRRLMEEQNLTAVANFSRDVGRP